MINKNGVLLLFFDLPVSTKKDRREYTAFRRFLRREGYRAMQKSVYVKLLRNRSTAKTEQAKLEHTAPKGSIFVLPLGLREFQNLKAVRGAQFDFHLFSNEILCI